MSALAWVYDDGGRAAAGFKGKTGDCVCRAIAIAAERPYREVYDALEARQRKYRVRPKSAYSRALARRFARYGTSPRNGINRAIYRPYLELLGWRWVPVLCGATWNDVPREGRIIVVIHRHVAAVIDGVVHDSYELAQTGIVCGYFQAANQLKPKREKLP